MSEYGDIDSHGLIDPIVWDGSCGDDTCKNFADYKCQLEEELCDYDPI